MHTIRAAQPRNIRTVVHDERRARALATDGHVVGQCEHLTTRHALGAELNQPDPDIQPDVEDLERA